MTTFLAAPLGSDNDQQNGLNYEADWLFLPNCARLPLSHRAFKCCFFSCSDLELVFGFRAGPFDVGSLTVTTHSSRPLHVVSGCTQMQAIFGGARAASSHSQKAVQNIAESALPLWSRQSSQLTSACSASGSAACLLAKRHCQSGTFDTALNTHQVRHLVQAVLTSNTAGQGRGFAAQAIVRAGRQC